MREQSKSDYQQFFVVHDNSPVSAENFRKVLKQGITDCELNPALYGTHSLRSGHAVDLLHYGVPLPTIKIFGRWRNNAIYSNLKNM